MKQGHKTRAQLAGEVASLEDQHRRDQAAIQEQQHLYRVLVENSLGLICSHDLDGVLRSINPAAAQSLGYEPHDGVGRNLRDFLAPSVRQLFDDYLARIRANRTDSGLLRLVARDGGERVWAYRNVLYEEPGAPPFVLGHALDVTERIRAQQDLKQSRRDLERRVAERTAQLERSAERLQVSEARFRALTERASDLVLILSTDARCIYASPSHQRLLGYAPEQLEGHDVLGFIHPDDRPRAAAVLADGLTTPGPYPPPPLELRVRHADGTWRVLELHANNALDDPAVRGVIINARDISLRKQAEQERDNLLQREQEARAQAEVAMRVRDAFLTAAAHDLRTPLTVIVGHAGMMRLSLERRDHVTAEWLRRRLDPIANAASRMSSTIEDITDAAQLRIGQPLSLHTDILDVAALVRAAVAAVRDSVSRKAASVVIETIEQVTVIGDRARLERVLYNIIGNAIKYSPRGAAVHVSLREQQGWAVITVRDSGIGIPADELPRLFAPFYRASTALGIPGKGIGLAGARAIVEQHGGRVEIESAVGQGTIVTILLPPRPPTIAIASPMP